MSTKIYTAYKLNNPETFEEWLGDTRNTVLYNGYQIFKEHMITLMSHKGIPENDEEYGVLILETYLVIKDLYRNAAAQNLAMYNWDASLCINIYEGDYYIRPYPTIMGITGEIWDFLNNDTNLTFFGYWDQTDRPDDTCIEEWEYRKDIWDAICDPIKFQSIPNLMLDIITVDSHIDIMDWLRVRDDIFYERDNK